MLPGAPCHITQRGVDRRETLASDTDRETYLGLLQQNRDDSGVRLLGWCWMTNHVHLIALPLREDSLTHLRQSAPCFVHKLLIRDGGLVVKLKS